MHEHSTGGTGVTSTAGVVLQEPILQINSSKNFSRKCHIVETFFLLILCFFLLFSDIPLHLLCALGREQAEV